MASHLTSDKTLIQAVHDTYTATALSGTDSTYAHNVAEAFGYSPEELQSVPEEAHMGLSCGNPVAAASIREGESIIDLGSGGGIDVLLAASKVGPHGHVVGLDMSAEMINRSRRNALKQSLHPPSVAFVQAALTEPLPIVSNTIDCVLSNCVVNLLPHSGKASLLKEVQRVLKSGGRVVLDDIIAKQPLPDSIRNDIALYVGCTAGAIQIEEYKALLTDAGLSDIVFVDTRGDLNIYFRNKAPTSDGSLCCSASAPFEKPAPEFDANKWVASYQIYALKPKALVNMETTPSETQSPLQRWWDAYPAAESSPSRLTNDEVAALLRSSSIAQDNDYAVIDVRRDDHGGGHVRGSFQFPAQTFHDNLPDFYEKFGKTKKVIFYCQSSNGRGPRCAGWYQDYLNVHGISPSRSQAYILAEGIKGWLSKFGDDVDLVDRE